MLEEMQATILTKKAQISQLDVSVLQLDYTSATTSVF